jgi:hypothetical protein
MRMANPSRLPIVNQADIALCIPAFNAAGFLPRLLHSARAQSIPFAEIWVYDDASSDQTAAVAAALGARVVRGESNRGCSHGKNVLARSAACGWLHFHDADDELKPGFVEKALPWMQRSPPKDVVFFAYETRSHDNNELLGHRTFDGDALARDPLAYVLAEQINPFCGLYRREPFLRTGGWDEDPLVLQSEDQACHFRLAAAGLTFASDPSTTVINYIRQGSMTTSNLPGANRSAYQVMCKAAQSPLLKPVHRQIVGLRAWRIAANAAAYLDWETANLAANLALTLKAPLPPETGLLFRSIAHFSVRMALRMREFLIRTLKPGLRAAPVYHAVRAGPR